MNYNEINNINMNFGAWISTLLERECLLNGTVSDVEMIKQKLTLFELNFRSKICSFDDINSFLIELYDLGFQNDLLSDTKKYSTLSTFENEFDSIPEDFFRLNNEEIVPFTRAFILPNSFNEIQARAIVDSLTKSNVIFLECLMIQCFERFQLIEANTLLRFLKISGNKSIAVNSGVKYLRLLQTTQGYFYCESSISDLKDLNIINFLTKNLDCLRTLNATFSKVNDTAVMYKVIQASV
ncbi:hypothetical protein [Sphingobacterium sp. GVS05A]|uniref:hypothetical protein n=1 Tax=Sphingobacterium sp. GVS05A TaxID=2862679 RepID=UPI001CBDB00C|nr:hypothetical protein [Sphingobacterium sp. GVS05A]